MRTGVFARPRSRDATCSKKCVRLPCGSSTSTSGGAKRSLLGAGGASNRTGPHAAGAGAGADPNAGADPSEGAGAGALSSARLTLQEARARPTSATRARRATEAPYTMGPAGSQNAGAIARHPCQSPLVPLPPLTPVRDSLPARTFPFVNYAIIAANIAVFLLENSTVASGVSADRLAFTWGLVPRRLLLDPALGTETIFTSMFMHGSLGHLAGNMLFLWIFGDNVEDALGHVRYVAFYL